ncbi:ABC transporter substrate-binding protein [Sinomonas halotolerans]|uniref:ABC transporter substrate-binding protein n=1 Tax=Sinomonas halotolerans TaxID=1644133 RepID=A0ABU9WWT6_9MICC
MQRSIPAALAAVLALSLAACGGGAASSPPASDGSPTTLKVGTIGIGSDAALAYAQEKGYFADEGISVETTVVANPPAGIAAAQSGQLDLTYTPSIPLLNALSQKVPLKIVAAADGYSDDALKDPDSGKYDDTGLFVRSDSGIARPKDLEGTSVSVPARRAQLEVTVSKAVADDGGDPSKINWMVLDPSSAMQSLEQGRIDAASLIAPFTARAKDAGHVLLASPGLKFFERGAIGLWVTGPQAAQGKEAQLEAFERAIYKANAYANAHPGETLQKIAEVTKTAPEVVRLGALGYWPDSVRLDDVQRTNALLAELGFLKEEVPLDATIFLNAPS